MVVDDYIIATMTRNHIPGLSVAVIQEGELVMIQGYGLANIEHSVPAKEQVGNTHSRKQNIRVLDYLARLNRKTIQD